MNDPSTSSGLNNLTTLKGGIEIEVSFANDLPNETVKIRQLPLRAMADYGRVIQDESAAIELYCNKPQGWADTLSPASASEIADKGQELNLPFFRAWFQRQLKRADALQPGVIAEVEKNLRAQILRHAQDESLRTQGGSASNNSSSTVPPVAG